MSEITVQTNNQARDVLYWWNLTPKERADFDYLNTEARQNEAQFMRYRGVVYDLGEFMRADGAFNNIEGARNVHWDGYASDTFFSGVLIRYVDCCERVIVATYYN